MVAEALRWGKRVAWCYIHVIASERRSKTEISMLTLRSALLRASRRARPPAGPSSFETLAAQAPQDEELALRSRKQGRGNLDVRHRVHPLPARSVQARAVRGVFEALAHHHPEMRRRSDRLFHAARGHQQYRVCADHLRESGCV